MTAPKPARRSAAELTAYERDVMVRFALALKRWKRGSITAQQAFPSYHRDCSAARRALERLVSHGWLRKRRDCYALGPMANAPASVTQTQHAAGGAQWAR